MTKTRKKYLILFAVLAVIVFLIVWGQLYLHDPEKIYIHRDGQTVVHFGDDYLYSNEDGIFLCENNKCICDIKGKKVLSASGDKLYVYVKDSGEIIAFSSDLKSETVGKIKSGFNSFAFYDEMFFAASDSGSWAVFNDKLEECSFETIKTIEENYSHIEKYKSYYAVVSKWNNKVNNDFGLTIYDSSKTTDNIIIQLYNNYAPIVVSADKDSIIISAFSYVGSSPIYKFSLVGDESEMFRLPNDFNLSGLKTCGDKYIYWGSHLVSDPHAGPPESFKAHDYDKLGIVDNENMKEISTYKTAKHEKIIYADDSRMISFFDGNYYTYSVGSWKELSKKEAKKLKKDGVYTFEACGEYVFVFDDDTGECIDRIKI